jgi:hypothetical protein
LVRIKVDEKKGVTKILQELITDEFMKAIGLSQSHWSRVILHALSKRGTYHFAEVCSQLNTNLGTVGFIHSVKHLAPNFLAGCYHFGTSNIPTTGPLLVTSNHPGGADSVAILSHIKREDVKIVITGVPFTEALFNARKHFIFVKTDVQTRSQVIRQVIQHLRNKGAVLIFPTGHVTPDPDLTPNADLVLKDWSPSIALILRKVPETQLLMSVVSGVIEKRFLNSPFCKIRKDQWRQHCVEQVASPLGDRTKLAG